MAKVMQFYRRETPVRKPNREKPEKPAEVIELTRERIELVAKHAEKAKAEEKETRSIPWCGFF